MLIKGTVWKYGDDVNTDVMFPGKYTYTISDPREMAAHALEDLDPGFAKGCRKGDIIIAGSNFGCGSSREQAPIAIREAGAGAIVAKSFARIFFRNAINEGLLTIVCPEAADAAERGDLMEIDVETGTIGLRGRTFAFAPFAKEVRQILACGGLTEYTRRKIAGELSR